MKICTRCGSRNAYTALYCTACGNDRFIAEGNTYKKDNKNVILGVVAGVTSMVFVTIAVVLVFFLYNNAKPEADASAEAYSYGEEYDDTDYEQEEDSEDEASTTREQEVTKEENEERPERADKLEREPEPEVTEPYYAIDRSKMYSDDYILPTDIRYITPSELDKFSYYEMDYVTNEIYARHGYIFNGGKFADYFEARRWYHPVTRSMDEAERKFSAIEKANIETIVSYEEAKGWREKRPSTTVEATTVTEISTAVEMPDVIGQDYAEAKAVLESYGYSVSKTEKFSNAPEGKVIEQYEDEGLTVKLVVSKGLKSATAAYTDFLLSEGRNHTDAHCEIADVNGDSKPELLLENWGGQVIVYTYDAQNDELIELARKGMAKGYAMQMYYNSEKCQVVFPSANTGGKMYEIVEFDGMSCSTVKTMQTMNPKHSDDGNAHFYINGEDVTQEEFETEEGVFAEEYYGVDLTVTEARENYGGFRE